MNNDKDYLEPNWEIKNNKKRDWKFWLKVISSVVFFVVLLALRKQGWNIWTFLTIVLVSLFTYSLEKLHRWFKYYVIWSWSYDNIDWKLMKLWNSKGIVEITGGAESGKTTFFILLSLFLKAKIWCNIPNRINDCQLLELETLKNHWQGNYKDGIIGKNNVLLIDDSWHFFNKDNLKKSKIERNLGDILMFLSETSKTGIKIFYAKKLGAKLPKSFDILSENKSMSIETLGIKRYVVWRNKDYYYLKIRIDGKEIIYIPFKKEIFDKFDNTWNVDERYAKERLKSVIDHLDPDELVQMIGHRKSRSELMREEDELENYGKSKYPNSEKYDIENKYWNHQRKQGFESTKGKLLDLSKHYKELLSNKNLGLVNENQFKIREKELLDEIYELKKKSNFSTDKSGKNRNSEIVETSTERRKPGRPPFKNKEQNLKIVSQDLDQQSNEEESEGEE